MKLLALVVLATMTCAGCTVAPPAERFRAAVAACDEGDAGPAFQLGDSCPEAKATYYSKYAPSPDYHPGNGIH
jgi:hypothetical protein